MSRKGNDTSLSVASTGDQQYLFSISRKGSGMGFSKISVASWSDRLSRALYILSLLALTLGYLSRSGLLRPYRSLDLYVSRTFSFSSAYSSQTYRTPCSNFPRFLSICYPLNTSTSRESYYSLVCSAIAFNNHCCCRFCPARPERRWARNAE